MSTLPWRHLQSWIITCREWRQLLVFFIHKNSVQTFVCLSSLEYRTASVHAQGDLWFFAWIFVSSTFWLIHSDEGKSSYNINFSIREYLLFPPMYSQQENTTEEGWFGLRWEKEINAHLRVSSSQNFMNNHKLMWMMYLEISAPVICFVLVG